MKYNFWVRKFDNGIPTLMSRCASMTSPLAGKSYWSFSSPLYFGFVASKVRSPADAADLDKLVLISFICDKKTLKHGVVISKWGNDSVSTISAEWSSLCMRVWTWWTGACSVPRCKCLKEFLSVTYYTYSQFIEQRNGRTLRLGFRKFDPNYIRVDINVWNNVR